MELSQATEQERGLWYSHLVLADPHEPRRRPSAAQSPPIRPFPWPGFPSLSVKQHAGFACHLLLQEAFPDFAPYSTPPRSELLRQVRMDDPHLSMCQASSRADNWGLSSDPT